MEKPDTSHTGPARLPGHRPPPDVRRRFRLAVAASLEAGLVRYSRRRELLQLAERLGLAPFEAGLIIAEVQYGERSTRRTRKTPDYPRQSTSPRSRRLRLALAFLRILIAGLLMLTVTSYLLG